MKEHCITIYNALVSAVAVAIALLGFVHDVPEMVQIGIVLFAAFWITSFVFNTDRSKR